MLLPRLATPVIGDIRDVKEGEILEIGNLMDCLYGHTCPIAEHANHEGGIFNSSAC